MKIGDSSDKPTSVSNDRSKVATDSAGKTGATAAPAPAPAQAESSTKVALSSQATQLLSGNGQVTGEFDAEKVERIAQAISDGKFEINAPAIADKLLANAREVLGKAHH